MSRTFFFLFLLLLQWLVPASAAANCTVVDLMPAFWKALSAEHPAAEVRKAVIDSHPDVYNDHYVALPDGAKWERKFNDEKAYDVPHRPEITAAEQYLAVNVPDYMRAFRRTFGDYRCDLRKLSRR